MIQDLADTRKYGKAYVDHIHELEKELGMKRGKRMNHHEANYEKVNPKYGNTGYEINCSTCSGTYYMRRLGFDVTAKANIAANAHVHDLSICGLLSSEWHDCTPSILSSPCAPCFEAFAFL